MCIIIITIIILAKTKEMIVFNLNDYNVNI
jgi:hypothetical protein